MGIPFAEGNLVCLDFFCVVDRVAEIVMHMAMGYKRRYKN